MTWAETMTKEYIVWGKSPKNPEHEEPLYTKAKSPGEAKRIMETLKANHGCHDMRVQVLDLSTPLNWNGYVTEALKR